MKVKKYIALLAGLVIPGAGHIIAGYIRFGFFIFSLFVAYVIMMTYLVAFSPWISVVAVTISAGIAIFSGISAFRYSTHAKYVKAIIVALSLVSLVIVFSLVHPLRRVVFFEQMSDISDPIIKEGDTIAVDRWNKRYNVNDMVVVEFPDRSVTRRIEEVKQSTVIVVSEHKEYLDRKEVEISQIGGKIIYIFVSREPGTMKFRFNRFLKPL